MSHACMLGCWSCASQISMVKVMSAQIQSQNGQNYKIKTYAGENNGIFLSSCILVFFSLPLIKYE